MTRIKLMRAPDRANSRTEIKVYINEVCVAQVANGCSLEVAVAAGAHVMYLKAGEQKSKKYYFNIREGAEKAFVMDTNKQANRFGAFAGGSIIPDLVVNGLMLLYYFTIGQNRYLRITPISKEFR